jgi:hypothetical protein
MKPYNQKDSQEYDKSGKYKLSCATCNLSYIGQTDWSLKQSYSKHIRYDKTIHSLLMRNVSYNINVNVDPFLTPCH